MAKHDYFTIEFDRLAVNGFIGRPDGQPAYAYLRVSSDEQGDEGRSGLPRQIEHVHEKAYQAGYCIPWDRVYADDFTGFELERPELSRLRREYRTTGRAASTVVMEHLDRLSRNADWHQGFLLDEMKRAGIEPVFWKSFSSRVERMVMGAVAQDGMEQAKARMRDGTLRKARSGRVTARRPAYGYKFVDRDGNEGAAARRDTHYALHDEQAQVVRLIYHRVASGDTLRKIAVDLTDAHVPTNRNGKAWEATVLKLILSNPLYKGEYISNRWIAEKEVVLDDDGVPKQREKRRRERPEAEWIRVPAPAIVDAETWQAANDMLAKNKQMASRNARDPYLLTGLIKCASCGYTYTGRTQRKHRGRLVEKPYRGYYCPNLYTRPRPARELHHCDQAYINAKTIEPAVWSVVCNALLEPDALLVALESDVFNEQNASVERQISYLEREIEAKQAEDERLYRAYAAGAFDEAEYAARRKLLKAEAAQLKDELGRLYPQRVSRDHFEAQRAVVLSFAEKLRGLNAHVDPPFELKRRILKMTVNRIVLNVREKWFRLDGTIRGTYPIEKTPVRV